MTADELLVLEDDATKRREERAGDTDSAEVGPQGARSESVSTPGMCPKCHTPVFSGLCEHTVSALLRDAHRTANRQDRYLAEQAAHGTAERYAQRFWEWREQHRPALFEAGA